LIRTAFGLLNASLQNLVSRGKNPLCATLWNRRTSKPVLNVATAILGTRHAERFQAEESNGLGLYFFEIAR